MRAPISLALAVIALAAPGAARADDDGYCDYVEGVAAAESALLVAPEVFGQFGYIEQPLARRPCRPPIQGGLRFIGGLRWRLSGIYEGVATRGRADADCRRHRAFEQVRGETLYRALEARAQVLDGRAPRGREAARAGHDADFEARRTTAQEATATRLRVEELRRIADGDPRRRCAPCPAPGGGNPAGALSAFHRADDDVERYDARLRRARARRRQRPRRRRPVPRWRRRRHQLAVLRGRLGRRQPRRCCSRAPATRAPPPAAASSSAPAATPSRPRPPRALVEATARRAADTATLEADLARQLETLARVGGDDSKRYRQIVWFDWIKVRAEHAYHEAHLAALQQVAGS